MGKGFKLVDTNLKPTAGTATYTDANRTITWTAPGLKPLQGQDGLFYAELKYQVTPTDEILNTTKGPKGYYTNESASMTYKDGDTPGTKDFPKPAVDVLLVKLVKEFAGGANSGRTFKVNITPNNGSAKEYTLTPGKAQLVTNLTVGGTYTIEETGVTGGGTVADYAVKINGQDGAKLEGYTVPQGNKWGMSDTEIKVKIGRAHV